MKQTYKNLSTSYDTFIIMGIPATIEFLSSLRSSFQLLAISFQLLAIKNRTKATTEKPKGMKLFCSKYFYENIKTSV